MTTQTGRKNKRATLKITEQNRYGVCADANLVLNGKVAGRIYWNSLLNEICIFPTNTIFKMFVSENGSNDTEILITDGRKSKCVEIKNGLETPPEAKEIKE